MTTLPKRTNVDTTNLESGEFIHMDFDFYNMKSIQGFTSMRTVMCAKTIMIWVFTTESKKSQLRTICFILTTFKKKNIHAGV